MKGIILVADDDVEDQMILLEYLDDSGIPRDTVRFFSNGKALLDYLATDATPLPRLIVLDLNMPLLNGTTTLIALKADPKVKHIPVVIYSTSNNEHEQRKCFSFGAHDFVVKPSTVLEGEKMTKIFLSFLK